MSKTGNWKIQAVELAKAGSLSWRAISKVLGVPKSTLSDHLRKRAEEAEESRREANLDATEKEFLEEKAETEDTLKSIEDYFVAEGSLSSVGGSGDFKGDEMNALNVNVEKSFAVGKLAEPEQDNSRILVISDLHCPFVDPNTIAFLAQLKEQYNFTRIISVGDEVEHASLSYHESDPELPSAGDELHAAKKVIAELFKMFPKMDILESNHGSLHLRKAMTAGIPKAYMREYSDILGVDNNWKWFDDMIITLPSGEDCYFTHGKSSNGLKLSQSYGMNCVQGHYHSEFNVSYWGSPKGLYWSMQVGCLVDGKSLAMAYNRLQLKRPIIGCGVIIDSKPILMPMLK